MAASLASALPAKTAENLAVRFQEVRQMTLRLTESLSAEDQMLQSMPDASPVKWHLAHTTWFYETFILSSHLEGYKTFDPCYKTLFNSYYKQLGSHPNRGARGLMSRPSLEHVLAFREHVDASIASLLNQSPLNQEIFDLIELGLNHEQQHQELILTDIKHALWSSPLPPEFPSEAGKNDSASDVGWTEMEGGIHTIGHNGNGFAFDNEGPRHDVLLRPFKIANRCVTNAEFLEFMEDGGYRRPELWLSDGWDAVTAQSWNSPLYWDQHKNASWWQFDRERMTRVDAAEPLCHVSYYEADAYARWAGARLPTEQEWEVVAARNPAKGTLLEDFVLHPQASEDEGLQQLFGDVWEWTASPYTAYPGFIPAKGLLAEYNGKFMCNQMVLRGGSCATPASHIRASYRNFFPPHARWQFSGIRLAR